MKIYPTDISIRSKMRVIPAARLCHKMEEAPLWSEIGKTKEWYITYSSKGILPEQSIRHLKHEAWTQHNVSATFYNLSDTGNILLQPKPIQGHGSCSAKVNNFEYIMLIPTEFSQVKLLQKELPLIYHAELQRASVHGSDSEIVDKFSRAMLSPCISK